MKPKFSPNTILIEGSFFVKQCACSSSLVRGGCIQPNCQNYHKGFPNEEINKNAAVYDLNGKLLYYWDMSDFE